MFSEIAYDSNGLIYVFHIEKGARQRQGEEGVLKKDHPRPKRFILRQRVVRGSPRISAARFLL